MIKKINLNLVPYIPPLTLVFDFEKTILKMVGFTERDRNFLPNV